MELGLVTFGDLPADRSPEQRTRELLEEITLSDSLGLDVFAVGEHHREDFAVPYLAVMNRIGRERGWPPSGAPEYERLRSPRGALAVGDVEQVTEKILYEHELFHHTRYLGHMSLGAVSHRDVMRSIELFAGEVAPMVRAEIARREAPTSPRGAAGDSPAKIPEARGARISTGS